MKKLSKIASVTLAAALSLSVMACANGNTSGGSSGGKQDGATKIEFKTGNDFFAMSAASGVSFLDVEGSANRSNRRARMLKNGEELPLTQEQTEQNDQAGQPENEQEKPATDLTRPAEFTDENIAEIKNSLTMFEAVVGGGVSSTVESCGEADGEYAAYAYKMTITFGGETAVLY